MNQQGSYVSNFIKDYILYLKIHLMGFPRAGTYPAGYVMLGPVWGHWLLGSKETF
jgi:hypothetical protein